MGDGGVYLRASLKRCVRAAMSARSSSCERQVNARSVFLSKCLGVGRPFFQTYGSSAVGREVLSSGYPRSFMAVLPVVVIRSSATVFADVRAPPAPNGEQMLTEHASDFRKCCRRKRRPTSPMRKATLRTRVESPNARAVAQATNPGEDRDWTEPDQPSLRFLDLRDADHSELASGRRGHH